MAAAPLAAAPGTGQSRRYLSGNGRGTPLPGRPDPAASPAGMAGALPSAPEPGPTARAAQMSLAAWRDRLTAGYLSVVAAVFVVEWLRARLLRHPGDPADASC